jgi:YHS domain-containing protein
MLNECNKINAQYRFEQDNKEYHFCCPSHAGAFFLEKDKSLTKKNSS